MKLYLQIFLMGWSKTMAARAAMMLYLLLSVLQTILGLGVWLVASQTSILRTSVPSRFIVSYFVYILLFQAFVWSGVSRRIGQLDIRRGQLSILLLKPCSYFVTLFLEETTWRILRSLITIPPFLLFFFLFRSTVIFEYQWLLAAFIFFPLGYLTYFLIQSIVGLLAFWFEDIEEYIEVVEIVMILFSGVGIPILFFPSFLQTISSWMPFQYILFIPTMTTLGRLSVVQILNFFLILAAWAGILTVILSVLWKRGLRHYTGEGI